MVYLAIASWPLGEVDRAISLIDRMQTRIADLTHVGTLAFGRMYAAMFELMRGDHARAAPNAFELARLAREHDLPMWRAFGVFLEGWATAASGAAGGGLEDMRRGVELLREQNVLMFDGLLKIALAEAEARAGDPDRAIAILDEALATCDRTGYRAFEAELHRARGEILLKRDPANPAPAEEAFLTAIAVAKQQATRSFELRAALVARQALPIDRPPRRRPRRPRARARRLFARRREMPEIAEAQALLAALAQTDEVKAQAAQRQRLTQLQVAYGNALYRGARLRRAGNDGSLRQEPASRPLATRMRPSDWRPTTAYGPAATCEASCHRCGRTRRPSSATSRRDPIRPRPASPIAPPGSLAGSPASIARRGIIWNVRSPCSNPAATTIWPFASDRTPASPRWLYLAIASWPLGEVDRAISLIDRMQTRIADLTHVGTLAFGRMHAALFELMRGDHARAAPNAFELARLAREHDLPMWRAFGVFLAGLGDRCERRGRQRARGHAPRRRAAARTERSDFRRAIEDRAGRGRGPGGRSRPRRRHPRRSAGDVRPHRAIARSKRNCIGRAAKSCSSATPPTPRPRKKPS